jgi:hypothetical protein
MTTGIQFAHINWYSQKGASTKHTTHASHGSERGRGWSNAEVLAEATRKHGHCGHVESPQPPTIMHGTVEEIEEAIDLWTASQSVTVTKKDGTTATRKMRSDAPSMAAGVISLPRDRLEDWPAFRDQAISALQEKHGDRLRCVIEHLDEKHPHLHFYLVPRPGEDFGVVHDGYKASREARDLPGNKIRTAYNDAMSKWQDWVQQAIAGPFELARLGPGRQRLSRKAWKADEIRRLELRERTADQKEEAVNKMLTDIERREKLLNDKQRFLKSGHAFDVAQLDEQKQAFESDKAKAVAQVKRLQDENERTRDKLAQMYSTLTASQKAQINAREPEFMRTLLGTPEPQKTAPKPFKRP